MSENRLRLPSDSEFYPAVSESLGADHNDLINFHPKANFEGLLRESLSQLSQLLEENTEMLVKLFEYNKTLKHLNQSIQNL